MTFQSEESYSFSDTFIFCDFIPLRASMKNFPILMSIAFKNTVLFWSYPSIMNDHEAMYSYPELELTRLTQDLYASSNNCINFSKISTTFIFPLQKDNYIPITITMYWKKRNEE